MKQQILIGTSGYSYKEWVGPVYPPGTAPKDFLELYSGMFPLAELNFSYYRQPDQRTMGRMAHMTGDDFTFVVKGHKSLTHEIKNFREDAAVFKHGIGPLTEAGKLGAVLLQFPYSFHYVPRSRKYLDALCAEFEHIPLAVEFRNSEWQNDSVYNGLKKRNVALVSVDEPDLPKLLKPTEITTADFAYVRFHGRNQQNWWTGDNVSRYDYLYSDDELMEWVPRIQTMAATAHRVMVAFNNHSKGQAAQNAKRLKEMLEG
ncbi:MAG: DUF72 domain-containing protein [Chitinivibrionales bacterium]|nr:DUF72 domain-containing protein [Chitinivibrionales bacterium]